VPQAAATRFVDSVAEQLRALAKEAQDRVAASRPVSLRSLEELLSMTPGALGIPGEPAAHNREGSTCAATGATERALRALDQLAAWADGLTYHEEDRGKDALHGKKGVGIASPSQRSTAAIIAAATAINDFDISNDARDAAATTVTGSSLHLGMDGGVGGTGGLLGAELAPAAEELEEAVAERQQPYGWPGHAPGRR
jgi:hypothetical protein